MIHPATLKRELRAIGRIVTALYPLPQWRRAWVLGAVEEHERLRRLAATVDGLHGLRALHRPKPRRKL